MLFLLKNPSSSSTPLSNVKSTVILAMGHGGNKVIPNTHFRKDWQLRVRTWFDQPAKKLKRRNRRAAKAKAAFPRPVERLRPLVHAPTAKYNSKTRAGRGFSLDELKVC